MSNQSFVRNRLKWHRDDIRGIIFYNYCRGLTAEECEDEIRKIMPPDCWSSMELINGLYDRFQTKNFALTNDVYIEVTFEEIDVTYKILAEDSRIDIEVLQYLGILPCETTLYEILYLLDYTRVMNTHVPRVLGDEKKRLRIEFSFQTMQYLKKGKSKNLVVADVFWIYHREKSNQSNNISTLPPLQRYRMMNKTLCVVFISRCFNFRILVKINSRNRKDPLKWYFRRPLREILKRIKIRLPGAPLLYHYDSLGNQMWHRQRIEQLANEYELELIQPAPYSPDLSFSCHGLFDFLKLRINPPETEYETMAEVAAREIVDPWLDVETKQWHMWFLQWVKYMRMCCYDEGRYPV